MKIRLGFVSNSSSTSFVIANKSSDKVDLVKFVEENPKLITAFTCMYNWNKPEDGYNQEELLKSAKQHNMLWEPFEKKVCTFGDKDGTLIGKVFDYILRSGGNSKSFKWSFYEFNR